MGHFCALLLGKIFARLDEENLRPVLESILDPSQQIRFELFCFQVLTFKRVALHKKLPHLQLTK